MNCPTCGSELRYMEQYSQWYCYICQTWQNIPIQPPVQPIEQHIPGPIQQQPIEQSVQYVSTEYSIRGDIIPAVTISLKLGEIIRAQAGAMMYRDPAVNMRTVITGGMRKALGRKFLGRESMALVEFIGPGSVTLTGGYMGKIIALELRGNAIRTKSGAFIACESGVEMEVTTEKIGTAIIGGTGLFQLRLYGNGIAFAHAIGDVFGGTLQQGESIIADENHFLACDDTVVRQREHVKGFKNIFTGGEGLYLLKLTGPGRYWLETGNIYEWIGAIGR